VPATTKASFEQIGLTALQFGSYSAAGTGTFEGADYELTSEPFGGGGQAVSVPFSLKLPATGTAEVTYNPANTALVPFPIQELDNIEKLTLLSDPAVTLLPSQLFGPSHNVKLGSIEVTAPFLYRFDFHGFEVRQNGAATLTPWSTQPFGIDFPFFFDAQVPVEVTMYVDIWLADLPGYGLTSPKLLLQSGAMTGSSLLSGQIYGPALSLEPSIIQQSILPPGPERSLGAFTHLKLGALNLAGSFSAPVSVGQGDSPADVSFSGTAAWDLSLGGSGAWVEDWALAFVVPEPSGLGLLTGGLGLLVGYAWSARRRTGS
jgi:hypothetical protein